MVIIKLNKRQMKFYLHKSTYMNNKTEALIAVRTVLIIPKQVCTAEILIMYTFNNT